MRELAGVMESSKSRLGERLHGCIHLPKLNTIHLKSVHFTVNYISIKKKEYRGKDTQRNRYSESWRTKYKHCQDSQSSSSRRVFCDLGSNTNTILGNRCTRK